VTLNQQSCFAAGCKKQKSPKQKHNTPHQTTGLFADDPNMVNQTG
jgi:hypothetical protein